MSKERRRLNGRRKEKYPRRREKKAGRGAWGGERQRRDGAGHRGGGSLGGDARRWRQRIRKRVPSGGECGGKRSGEEWRDGGFEGV